MQDHIIDEYEWCMVRELDGVVRPVGPFISTMEATERFGDSPILILYWSVETMAAMRGL